MLLGALRRVFPGAFPRGRASWRSCSPVILCLGLGILSSLILAVLRRWRRFLKVGGATRNEPSVRATPYLEVRDACSGYPSTRFTGRMSPAKSSWRV